MVTTTPEFYWPAHKAPHVTIPTLVLPPFQCNHCGFITALSTSGHQCLFYPLTRSGLSQFPCICGYAPRPSLSLPGSAPMNSPGGLPWTAFRSLASGCTHVVLFTLFLRPLFPQNWCLALEAHSASCLF